MGRVYCLVRARAHGPARGWQVIKEVAKKQYLNTRYDQPYKQALYNLDVLLRVGKWHVNDYLAVIDDLHKDDLRVRTPLRFHYILHFPSIFHFHYILHLHSNLRFNSILYFHYILRFLSILHLHSILHVHYIFRFHSVHCFHSILHFHSIRLLVCTPLAIFLVLTISTGFIPAPAVRAACSKAFKWMRTIEEVQICLFLNR